MTAQTMSKYIFITGGVVSSLGKGKRLNQYFLGRRNLGHL
jgi:hypothetical protein